MDVKHARSEGFRTLREALAGVPADEGKRTPLSREAMQSLAFSRGRRWLTRMLLLQLRELGLKLFELARDLFRFRFINHLSAIRRALSYAQRALAVLRKTVLGSEERKARPENVRPTSSSVMSVETPTADRKRRGVRRAGFSREVIVVIPKDARLRNFCETFSQCDSVGKGDLRLEQQQQQAIAIHVQPAISARHLHINGFHCI